jgi:hypothetical protein
MFQTRCHPLIEPTMSRLTLPTLATLSVTFFTYETYYTQYLITANRSIRGGGLLPLHQATGHFMDFCAKKNKKSDPAIFQFRGIILNFLIFLNVNMKKKTKIEAVPNVA